MVGASFDVRNTIVQQESCWTAWLRAADDLTKTKGHNNTLNRGSYMSTHVLFNLLNELGKKIRCEALPSILSVFPNEFNKFNITGARMQDSIYHMTLKLHYISKFCIKTSRFRH